MKVVRTSVAWILLRLIVVVISGSYLAGSVSLVAHAKRPTRISWGTFLNGSRQSVVSDVAVDPAGDVCVVGVTTSRDFPVTVGALQATLPAPYSTCGFVAKLNRTGTRLLWSTYLGGTEGGGSASAVAVGPSGEVYVTGVATDGFPLLDSLQPYGGGGDAFIAKFDESGTLLYSTYLGGPAFDYAADIAVDNAGNAYIVGAASSDVPTIPASRQHSSVVAGSAESSDIYVAKIDTVSRSGVYATFLGGTNSDVGTSIALGHDGEVILGGWTFSEDFPTINAIQLTGAYSGAVAKLDAAGAVVFSTYFGGSDLDLLFGVGVDSPGNIYVAGETSSADFPRVNAQFAFAGRSDAFLTKLDPTGSRVLYSTTIGGGNMDRARSIAVTPSGEVAISVWTTSHDYPRVRPISNDLDGDAGDEGKTDVAVTLFAADGTVRHSSYVAGSSSDECGGIAVGPTGAIYVVGSTQSTDFPVTIGAFQPEFPGKNSNSSGFIVKIASVARRQGP